jgi:signal transduction histidine kinase
MSPTDSSATRTLFLLKYGGKIQVDFPEYYGALFLAITTMTISTLSLPPILICTICVYVGLYHFFVFIKRTQQKENLFFSICCLCVALYAYFCFRLYIVHDYESGIYWQRWQLASMYFFSTSFIWFIGNFVKVQSFKPIVLITTISSVFFFIGLFVRNELTLAYSRPAIKTIHLGAQVVTYFEAALGPIYQFQFAFYSLCMVYFAHICLKYRKNYKAKYAKFFFISIVVFFLGVFNDISVCVGFYQFVYLAEYTYLFIILTMAFILSGQFADLNVEIEAMNISLEQKIKERTKELVDKAHKAGMADIAAETLHNVGNLLNSVNASIEAMKTTMKDSALQGLFNAIKMLGDNMDRLDEFITVDPRGKKLLHYFLKLDGPIKSNCTNLDMNIRRLGEKVNSICDVIAAQQSYAGIGGFSENVKLSDLVDGALTMEAGSIERHKICIGKDFSEVPNVTIQKTKLIHILVNLFKNAKSALLENLPGNKKIDISIKQDAEAIFMRIMDNGCGIPRENLAKIFSHGFTTKKDGHGFGLHSCANYMKEMGGEMWAESEGEGKGATFVLKFNLNAPKKAGS